MQGLDGCGDGGSLRALLYVPCERGLVSLLVIYEVLEKNRDHILGGTGNIETSCQDITMIPSQKAINIETRRSTTPGKRVILVQGPC